MKVSVVTRWYNEEFFAPFFLNHYQWADEIIVLLEKSTSDKSASIIKQYKNAVIEWVHTDKYLNDRLLSKIVSDKVTELDCDWAIRADADEFIFADNFEDPKEVLEKADGNMVEVLFYWVYQHHTEAALDRTKPTILQRRHGGDYTIWPGMGSTFTKPAIVRPKVKIQWRPGDQSYFPNRSVIKSSIQFKGAHWQMADVDNAVKRNHKNESRLSKENIKNNWGVKNFTEEMIRAECKRHLNDPQIF